jgi:hypothetical protein
MVELISLTVLMENNYCMNILMQFVVFLFFLNSIFNLLKNLFDNKIEINIFKFKNEIKLNFWGKILIILLILVCTIFLISPIQEIVYEIFKIKIFKF